MWRHGSLAGFELSTETTFIRVAASRHRWPFLGLWLSQVPVWLRETEETGSVDRQAHCAEVCLAAKAVLYS